MPHSTASDNNFVQHSPVPCIPKRIEGYQYIEGRCPLQPRSDNHPKKLTLTGMVLMKDVSGNNLPNQILIVNPAHQGEQESTNSFSHEL